MVGYGRESTPTTSSATREQEVAPANAAAAAAGVSTRVVPTTVRLRVGRRTSRTRRHRCHRRRVFHLGMTPDPRTLVQPGQRRTYSSASGASMFEPRSTNSQKGSPAAGRSELSEDLPRRNETGAGLVRGTTSDDQPQRDLRAADDAQAGQVIRPGLRQTQDGEIAEPAGLGQDGAVGAVPRTSAPATATPQQPAPPTPRSLCDTPLSSAARALAAPCCARRRTQVAPPSWAPVRQTPRSALPRAAGWWR